MDLTEKNQKIIKHKNVLPHITMGKKILTFGDTEIENDEIYRYKSPTF